MIEILKDREYDFPSREKIEEERLLFAELLELIETARKLGNDEEAYYLSQKFRAELEKKRADELEVENNRLKSLLKIQP